jgi:hypothetical protein
MTSESDGRLHFAGRDVFPVAVPVPEAELRAGHTYFTVHFLGPASADPELEAWVYVGADLFPGEDVRGFFFQNAASYAQGLRHDVGAQEERPDLELMRRGQVHVMYYEDALDVLLRCSLLRQQAGLR